MCVVVIMVDVVLVVLLHLGLYGQLCVSEAKRELTVRRICGHYSLILINSTRCFCRRATRSCPLFIVVMRKKMVLLSYHGLTAIESYKIFGEQQVDRR